MLEPDQPIPQFSVDDAHGNRVTDQDLHGAWSVVYFYPKDNTSGCTVEACSFRDTYPAFQALDADVYGVSTDTATSHQKFAADFTLPFRLLTDPDHRMTEAYEAWGEKSMYGKKYMGTLRTTCIVGPDATVKAVFTNVKPEGHAEAVREKLQELQGGKS
jgi:peroxiredoxin Q/BCP